ncbi:hypothetical protein [Parvicella tangerina]|uniref:Uncharacterized protein n=1 Tax=Parvicella tangerina TaxID=2829795 RepID=A0A916NAB0_9FLAO|nr:hypothetical protein [Parvicella tangerina]CAG5078825.1 hypothetical protein CRYO30217_00778 [Parvicella tangerina]
MTAKEHLYYGFGQVIYSLSFSDGEIQEEEKRKLEELVTEIAGENNSSVIQVTHIIFQLLDKEQVFTTQEMLADGIKNMKLGDQYFTTDQKELFLRILLEVAEAFPPAVDEELEVVSEYKRAFNY